MYTVLWFENGECKWDRFEDKEDVLELLDKIKESDDSCEGDVYVFPPEADAWSLDYESFMMMEGRR